jgi:DNA polymerase delta subunit 2
MQQSWSADADKLTFIICRSQSGVVLSASQTREGRLDVDSMIGDINLFISLAEDEATSKPILLGELELMIAERSEHRKGYGRSALLASLQYIIRHEIDILREFQSQGAQPSPSSQTRGQQCRRFDHFAVKIGESNHGSIALFEGLRFHKTDDTPSYFGEYELRLGRDAVDELLSSASSMNKFVEGYEEIGYSCPS